MTNRKLKRRLPSGETVGVGVVLLVWGIGVLLTLAFWGVVVWGIIELVQWVTAQ